jgi:hypothetical protein
LQARFFAERVLRQAGSDLAAQVRTAYSIALSRDPTAGELQEGVDFLKRQREYQSARDIRGANANLMALAAILFT